MAAKAHLFFTILCIIASPLFSQEPAKTVVVKKSVSEVKVDVIIGIDKIERLEFNPSTKVQVGNSSLLNYQLIPQKKEITFKGVKPGNTSVIVRDQTGEIRARYIVNITANDQSKVVQELRDFLEDVEGIEIGIKGGSVYVGGDLVVPNDIGKVVVVLEKYPDVIRLVELSPQTQRVISRKMQDEIQRAGFRDVTVRVVNGLFWLEGVVGSEGEKTRAEQIAVAYIPDRIESLARRTDAVQQARKPIIQNFISVNAKNTPPPVPKQIKVTAQLIELTKDYNRIFGFKWNPTLGGTGGEISVGKTNSGEVTTRSSGTFSATITNLIPKLASAKAAGHARVIQSGVVIMKENTTATIAKTTRKPFSLGTGEFVRESEANAGFELNIKSPRILPEEKIDMSLGLSVSAAVGDPPETTTNRVQTAVVIKSKQSAAIGGVVIKRSSTDFDRNAPFGEENIEDNSGQFLFNFIRSKSFASNKSQFVIFITPEIIDSASEGSEEIRRKFRRRRR